jgi:hypothetical protein
VALYSDGLVEARDVEGREFGYDRLHATMLQAAASAGDDPARDVRDGLLAALDAFADPDSVVDDTTLVVLAWSGEAAPAGDDDDDAPFTLRPAFAEAAAPIPAPS